MPTKWTPKPKPPIPPPCTTGSLGDKVLCTIHRALFILARDLSEFVQDVLAWPLHKLLETIEAEAAPKLAPFLDTVLARMPADHPLRPLFQELAHPTAQGFGALIAGAGSQVTSAGLGAILGAVLAEPTYSINRGFRPYRLDPGAAIALLKRDPNQAVIAQSDLLDLGLSQGRIDALSELIRSWPSGTDMLETVRRDPTYYNEAHANLMRQGFSAEDADRVLALRHPLTDANVARQLYVRREISEAQHDAMLSALGLTAGDIMLIKRLYFPIPGPQDLITMAVKEAFSEEQAAILGLDAEFPADFGYWGDRSGLAEFWAKRYWRAHWQLPSAQMGYEMLHRGIATPGELDALLKALDYTPYWRGKLKAMSYSPYTRVDIRRMYQTGILTPAQVLQSYKEIGYDDEHAENLALFTVMGASTAEKDLTKADILGGYRDGLLSRGEAGTQLQGMGYDASESEFYLARADLDLAAEQQGEAVEIIHQRYVQHVIIVTQARNELYSLGLAGLEIERLLAKWEREMRAAVKSLSRSDIEAMYAIGMISHQAALQALAAIGYQATTAGQLITLLDTQAQREREEAAARGVKYATSSELAKLIAQGLIAESRASELLAARGYNGETIQLYLSSWRLDRERQALAEEEAAEKRALAAIRRPSASEIRQLWDQDIIDSASARARLAELHYLPDVIDQTIALWQSLRAQAEAKEAATRQRAAEIRPRLLSVAQLHELYLSGVISLAEGRSGLRAQQYTEEDAGRLLAQWQLDLQAERERAELAALAVEERRARLLSRSQVGELYLARVIERARAEALLVGLRYSASDVRDTLTLWDMRLSEMAAKEAETGTAEPERKVKTLSRSDLGRLYTERIIEEPEVRAALANLGYYQTDIDSTMRLWTAQIADSVQAATEREQRQLEAATRQLTRAQLEQMYGLEVLTQTELVAGYYQLGYQDEDVTRMLAVIAAKREGA